VEGKSKCLHDNRGPGEKAVLLSDGLTGEKHFHPEFQVATIYHFVVLRATGKTLRNPVHTNLFFSL